MSRKQFALVGVLLILAMVFTSLVSCAPAAAPSEATEAPAQAEESEAPAGESADQASGEVYTRRSLIFR